MSLDVLATSFIDLHHIHSLLPFLPSTLASSSSSWIDLAAQGIADASVTAADVTDAVATTATKVCPNFGEKGWGPLCFLNGNPVFAAFDVYQQFIQDSVVSLNMFLEVRVLGWMIVYLLAFLVCLIFTFNSFYLTLYTLCMISLPCNDLPLMM